ncbi:hypothetical protein Tco_0467696 [Tanacetum coccineum]
MESQLETTQTVSALKLPILKIRDYDLWSMRIEQYLTHTDYALWEVIVNDDASAVVASASASADGPIPPKIAEQRVIHHQTRPIGLSPTRNATLDDKEAQGNVGIYVGEHKFLTSRYRDFELFVAPMANVPMEELLRAQRKEYGEAIVLPEIIAVHGSSLPILLLNATSSKMDERIDKLADQLSTLVEIISKKVVTPAPS